MKIQAAVFKKPSFAHPVRRKFRPKTRRTQHTAERLILLGLMLLALFGGAVIYLAFQSGMQQEIASYYQAYCDAVEAPFMLRLSASLLPALGAGFLLLYLGTSPFGVWGVLGFLALRCAATGSVAAFLVHSGGAAGIRAYFFGLFPGRALALAALFLLSGHAIKCSVSLKSCLKRDSSAEPSWFVSYLRACLPALTLLCAASLTDALLQRFCVMA